MRVRSEARSVSRRYGRRRRDSRVVGFEAFEGRCGSAGSTGGIGTGREALARVIALRFLSPCRFERGIGGPAIERLFILLYWKSDRNKNEMNDRVGGGGAGGAFSRKVTSGSALGHQ